MISNSAAAVAKEIGPELPKKAPFTTQNANPARFEELIQNVNLLLSEMNELEGSSLAGLPELLPEHRVSARNLIDYLALRRHDIRQLQGKLAELGLSSLGRTEPHVLSSLHAVLNVLHKLAGSDLISLAPNTTPQLGQGTALLARNAEALLGPAPASRQVRIMVTMPPEATTKYELVRNLLAQGMDRMRINCAHDGPAAWLGMIQNLRRAETETNKHCKVAMDLAGPKLRTGSIEPGPAVLKYHPKRDTTGRVISPARIWLTSASCPEAPPEPADAVVPVSQHNEHLWSPGKWSLGRCRADGLSLQRNDPGGSLAHVKWQIKAHSEGPRWRNPGETTDTSAEAWRYLDSNQIARSGSHPIT